MTAIRPAAPSSAAGGPVPTRAAKSTSAQASLPMHRGRALAGTGSDVDPAAAARATTNAFLTALGTPRTAAEYDVAIEGAVAAIAGRAGNGSPRYDVFNRLVLAMPPASRAELYLRLFAATAAEVPEAVTAVSAGRFSGQAEAVQDPQAFIVPPRTRAAHPDGLAGLVSLELDGDVPPALATAQARVRLGAGRPGDAPGIGIAFMGPGGDASRVFVKLGTSSYGATLPTHALGVSTSGPEGDLLFAPSPALAGLDVQRQGKPSNAWMAEARQLAPGTVLGVIKPERGSWSLTVKLGEAPLVHSLFAERSTRFPRQLHGKNLLGSLVLAAARLAGFFARLFARGA